MSASTGPDPAYEWTVTGFIDNLFDSNHGIIGFDVSGFTGNTQISYARPRTYGINDQERFLRKYRLNQFPWGTSASVRSSLG